MFNRLATTAAILVALALAGTASGGNKSSSSISPPIVVSTGSAPAPSTSTLPQYGDTITFTVSTTATSQPFVNLVCYQNGVLVANGWGAFFAGGLGGENFVLSSPAWSGGAANCTANLDMYVSSSKYKVLTSTSFDVSG